MDRDNVRIERLQRALHHAGLDAMICALPTNVLMLSGYSPVVGTSIGVVTIGGRVQLVVPEDERELALRGYADEVHTFENGSLERLSPIREELFEPLRQTLVDLGLSRGRLGYEDGAGHEPATYLSQFRFGGAMLQLLNDALPNASIVPASDAIRPLVSVLTPIELDRLRLACRNASHAFRVGAPQLRPGHTETGAASLFRPPLTDVGLQEAPPQRADGSTWCMSGRDGLQASGAYQRSRGRRLELGDLVLIHCNSYADGFWTDVTRTYCLGAPSAEKRAMYDAVLLARDAALAVIRPGIEAARVDAAARAVLESRGFGREFVHGTGHGVGFAAIDHNAPPRIHPASKDVLEPGMVFNVEPAVYREGIGGLRQCEMVAVTEHGAELLTPFHNELDSLILPRTQVRDA